MSNKVSQNIFDYATSELSQDAFISLLVAWFDSEEKELQNISKDFISSLYSIYFNNEELFFNKMESIKISRQHYKIDVYFELTYEGKVIPFIIEDKTWTEPHSNQLSRYVQKVSALTKYPEEENAKSEKIVKIFFKTGHITEKDELETTISKYTIIDIAWIYDFLSKYKIDNLIFNNYKDYLEKNFYKKLYNSHGKKELKDWCSEDIYNGYVQYSLIKEIKNELKRNTFLTHKNCVKFTRNGKSWDTWWTFYSNGFSLFVKIKRIGKLYRIRLIKYSKSKVSDENKYQNLENFSLYIDDFLNLNKDTNIQKTKKPRYKAREIELAFLELNSEISLEDSVKEFSYFIEFFIEKVKDNDSNKTDV